MFLEFVKARGHWLQLDARQKALVEWCEKQGSSERVEYHLFAPNSCSRVRALWITWKDSLEKKSVVAMPIIIGKCGR